MVVMELTHLPFGLPVIGHRYSRKEQPPGVKPEHNMIYAGTQPSVVDLVKITKVYEMRDQEDFTEVKLRGGDFP